MIWICIPLSLTLAFMFGLSSLNVAKGIVEYIHSNNLARLMPIVKALECQKFKVYSLWRNFVFQISSIVLYMCMKNRDQNHDRLVVESCTCSRSGFINHWLNTPWLPWTDKYWFMGITWHSFHRYVYIMLYEDTCTLCNMSHFSV